MDSPPWPLTVVAWCAIAVAGGCALYIIGDIALRRYRQRMWIMEVVWPVTALYAGPLAVWAYRRWGRPSSPRWHAEHGLEPAGDDRNPKWVSAVLGTSHCGGGCTLGDFIGAWIVFGFAFSIATHALWAEYIVDFSIAFVVGIAFQYFTIAPMRGLGLGAGLIAAIKADTLSLIAFEVGMFAWMALVQLVVFRSGLTPDHATYWLSMQIGMLFGFATSFPVNRWLLTHDLKESM